MPRTITISVETADEALYAIRHLRNEAAERYGRRPSGGAWVRLQEVDAALAELEGDDEVSVMISRIGIVGVPRHRALVHVPAAN